MSEKVPFYYLKSCDKCIKILKTLPVDKLDPINIKENPLDAKQIDQLKGVVGSYRELFNFRAQKLKEMDKKPDSEAEFRQLLIEDYTFLKRPLVVFEDKIISGNKPGDFCEIIFL